jgi:hypothetical protein
MNWKLLIVGSAIVSVCLTSLSWYFTLKLDPNGWGYVGMFILSLLLSIASLVFLLFPIGMAMEEPGENGKLFTFLFFLILLLLVITYLIFSPKAFVNGYYSWLGLGVFGYMTVFSFIKYIRSNED